MYGQKHTEELLPEAFVQHSSNYVMHQHPPKTKQARHPSVFSAALSKDRNIAHSLQDMPFGLHGIFPVRHGSGIYLAAGGTAAANSQSTHHLLFTP